MFYNHFFIIIKKMIKNMVYKINYIKYIITKTYKNDKNIIINNLYIHC